MSVPKSTRYDKYIPLFGRENDLRVRVFLDALNQAADNFNNAFDAAGLVAFPVQAQNQMNGVAADPTHLHAEWNSFFQHLRNRLARLVVNPAVPAGGAVAGVRRAPVPGPPALLARSPAEDQKVIDIIRGLVGPQIAGSLEEKMQTVVRKLLASATMPSAAPGGTDVLGQTDQWNNITIATFKDADALQDELFKFGTNDAGDRAGPHRVTLTTGRNTHGGVAAVAVVPATAAAADVAKQFIKFQPTKFWIQRTMEDAVANAKLPVVAGQESSMLRDDAAAPVESQKFYRKADGLLYTKKADGSEVAIHSGSEEFKNLASASATCVTTGFTDANTVAVGRVGPAAAKTCADYLQDCLSGNDAEQCRAYLVSPAFWANAQDEVKNMLPTIMLKTLRAFEFPTESRFVESLNARLIQVKPVEEWLKSIKASGKVNDAELAAITGNERLIGYLKMLVQRVNSEPALLNKDYKGPEKIASSANFAGSLLSKYGIKQKLAVPNNSNAVLERTLLNIGNRNRIVLGARMFGGAIADDLQVRLDNASQQTGVVLERTYLSLLQRLGAKGKQINKADSDKINELIANLKSAEVKLTKAIIYGDRYATLLEVYGQEDNTSLLNLNHLKQFVDARNKYFTRVAKKQNDLISIIRSIADALNKPTPDATVAVDTRIDEVVDFNALLG